jgi:exopolysaccharide biosynthesis polyprenyl glycosylphosphotransferase
MTTIETGPAPAAARYDAGVRSTVQTAPLPEGVVLAAFDLVAMAVTAALLGRRSGGAVVCVLFLLVVSYLNGTYRRPRLALTALGDMKATLSTASAPLVLCGVAAGLGQATPVTIRFAGMLVPAIAVARVLAYRTIRALRRNGSCIHRAIIVGSGSVADRLREVLEAMPEMGIEIVGYADEAPVGRNGAGDWIGPLDDLADLVSVTGATRVIAAYTWLGDDELAERLRGLQSTRAEVFVVPRLFEFGSSAGDTRTQSIGDIPIVWLAHREWRREQLLLKRTFDLVVATLGLLLLAPVMLITALAVLVSSRGPVIFRQVRVGRGGRTFTMYKFRSMRVAEAAERRQSGGGDPRVTRVGHLIRRLSIDELPQLLNVLKADMSIVGPRPEQPLFVDQCDDVPGYRSRHRLQVGLTGWSQVNRLRGADTSLEDRARYDNFYIEHWSIWLDMVIVIRTLVAAMRGS